MKLENLKGNTDILASMVYLNAAPDVGYTQEDINVCSKILDQYIESLIETDQRKDLCAYIISAATLAENQHFGHPD